MNVENLESDQGGDKEGYEKRVLEVYEAAVRQHDVLSGFDARIDPCPYHLNQQKDLDDKSE